MQSFLIEWVEDGKTTAWVLHYACDLETAMLHSRLQMKV